ncbi:hypothetical protein ACO0K2_07495 [Undibacterium sp. MH2W]|uniref:hypothetical protein n=1 Tax=Undibacterium sp. MH2W TaxID=3413044 RepID=UPI003BF40C7C
MLLIMRFFILIYLSIQFAYAGTKGFDVKLRNLGDKDFYQSPIFKQYLDNTDNNLVDECWHRYGDGISGIYYLNYGMFNLENEYKLDDVWNGKKEIIQKIRKGLHQANEHTTSEGYHGMYIIYPKDGYLTIMGVGANADPKKGLTGISPIIKAIKLDQSKPKEGAKIFERSLCRVSKPFNIGFGV